jgi:hypothetical protein
MHAKIVAVVILAATAASGWACGPYPNLSDFAQQTLSDDESQRLAAIETLRAWGPAGLQALLDTHAAMLSVYDASAPGANPLAHDPRWLRLCAALDGVGRARDNHAARLYWFTDFDAARATARATGKPILSLRLLGNLDEEYSCANSRFFRTVLYADPRVQSALRDRFVLHWQSVRPVPKVTIDFGDGRTLFRTLTGNSIHYVLDAEGRPVDALPGLYGPLAFLDGLTRAERLVSRTSELSDVEREAALRRHHSARHRALVTQWRRETGNQASPPRILPASSTPSAEEAAPVSMAKMVAEAPLLASRAGTNGAPSAAPTETESAPRISKRQKEAPLLAAGGAGAAPPEVAARIAALDRASAPRPPSTSAQSAAHVAITKSGQEIILLDPEPLGDTADLATWERIAQHHLGDAQLQPASIRLMFEKSAGSPVCRLEGSNPVPSAGDMTPDPSPDASITRRINAFIRSVALDTVRNELDLHRRIHAWFAQGSAPADVNELNERVYAELFLTPDTDPWLGLLQDDVYTALSGDGVHSPALLAEARR